MSTWRKYEVEVVFQAQRSWNYSAESEDDAKRRAVAMFRDWFAEEYDGAPPTSELDVVAEEIP